MTTSPGEARKFGHHLLTTKKDLEDEGGYLVARRRAVNSLRAIAAREKLELDEASVVMEGPLEPLFVADELEEDSMLPLPGDVMLRYTALAYPPGWVPQ